MPNVNLKNGKTIYIPAEQYYFMTDEELEQFYQSCMADDLGEFVDHALSGKIPKGKVESEEIPDIPDEDTIA